MEDGGYSHSTLWLSEGWATVEAKGWQAPMYWTQRDGKWWHFTLENEPFPETYFDFAIK